MKIKILALGVCVIWILPISLSAQASVVLKQEDAPFKITEYKSEYLMVSLGEERTHIKHSLKYLNNSEKKIEAVRARFICFNIFNEFLDEFKGIEIKGIKPNKEGGRFWRHICDDVESFEKFGRGVVFIDKVRFEDGKIWEANLDDIIPQIQEIIKDFPANFLK